MTTIKDQWSDDDAQTAQQQGWRLCTVLTPPMFAPKLEILPVDFIAHSIPAIRTKVVALARMNNATAIKALRLMVAPVATAAKGKKSCSGHS